MSRSGLLKRPWLHSGGCDAIQKSVANEVCTDRIPRSHFLKRDAAFDDFLFWNWERRRSLFPEIEIIASDSSCMYCKIVDLIIALRFDNILRHRSVVLMALNTARRARKMSDFNK
jgi:hypothetical protein